MTGPIARNPEDGDERGLFDGEQARGWWRTARMAAAITPDSPEARWFAGIGAGSYLAFPQGVLENPGRILLGSDCVINEHTVLAAGLPGDTEPGPARIVLGDRVVLGRATEILALGHVELGDDVHTASKVTIVDHHHRHDLPDVPVARQWPLTVRRVRIGAGSVISTGAVILAGADLGHNSLVASGAQVRAGVYPPRSVLAGCPARVVRTHRTHPPAPSR